MPSGQNIAVRLVPLTSNSSWGGLLLLFAAWSDVALAALVARFARETRFSRTHRFGGSVFERHIPPLADTVLGERDEADGAVRVSETEELEPPFTRCLSSHVCKPCFVRSIESKTSAAGDSRDRTEALRLGTAPQPHAPHAPHGTLSIVDHDDVLEESSAENDAVPCAVPGHFRRTGAKLRPRGLLFGVEY